jgi:intracellular sulfur oxidation DsrE/DsrF family protein
MKNLLLAVLLFSIAHTASAQKNVAKSDDTVTAAEQAGQHKIVFQLTTDDTLAHKALMKQLNNIISVAPDTKIEVVCHGPGLNMLVIGKSIIPEKIQLLKARGIDFLACEFSMKERNISREKIIPEAGTVPAGIIEIVTKQEQGWSYIKSGF